MNKDLLQKWLEGTLTEDERKVFESGESFKSLQRLSRSVQSFKAPDYDVESELARIRSFKPAARKIIAFSWATPFLRIAAALALFISCYYIFFSNNSATQVTVETLAGKKKEFILPDSSFVVLNASSHLSYSSEMKEREVKLDGEAYFKVKKGSRFEVITEAGKVTVLGTQFNIRHRKDFFEVICYEGSVRVETSEKMVQLKPTQVLRSIKGKPVMQFIIQDAGPSWVDNESSFQSVPLREVIKELEIQYNISVSTKDVDDGQLFTGRFPHNDLTLALKSITLPLNLIFNIQDNQHIVLSGDLE
ncbi:MAG: anti-sigma factor [Marivirga sp.]|nr:anti-sigma factor [Marivirga sp.]